MRNYSNHKITKWIFFFNYKFFLLIRKAFTGCTLYFRETNQKIKKKYIKEKALRPHD